MEITLDVEILFVAMSQSLPPLLEINSLFVFTKFENKLQKIFNKVIQEMKPFQP